MGGTTYSQYVCRVSQMSSPFDWLAIEDAMPVYIRVSAFADRHLLKLPPALLRKEPLLLAMAPDRLLGGFESLREELGCDDASVRESCKDTPGLLLESAKKWTDVKLPP